MTSIARSQSIAVALILAAALAPNVACGDSALLPGRITAGPGKSSQQTGNPLTLSSLVEAACPAACDNDDVLDKISETAITYVRNGSNQSAVEYLTKCSHTCKQVELQCALTLISWRWKGNNIEDVTGALRASEACLLGNPRRIIKYSVRVRDIQRDLETELHKRAIQAESRRTRAVGIRLIGAGAAVLGATAVVLTVMSLASPQTIYTPTTGSCTSGFGIPGDPCVLDRRVPIGIVFGSLGAGTLAAGVGLYFKSHKNR